MPLAIVSPVQGFTEVQPQFNHDFETGKAICLNDLLLTQTLCLGKQAIRVWEIREQASVTSREPRIRRCGGQTNGSAGARVFTHTRGVRLLVFLGRGDPFSPGRPWLCVVAVG